MTNITDNTINHCNDNTDFFPFLHDSLTAGVTKVREAPSLHCGVGSRASTPPAVSTS